MSPGGNPHVREIGYVVDIDGLRLLVGVNYDAVTLGFIGEAQWTVTRDQAEEFAQLYVSACWQAGQNARRMAEEVHEVDGGDSMAACDSEASGYMCSETGPHTVHLARGGADGVILHAWEDGGAQAKAFLRVRGDGAPTS